MDAEVKKLAKEAEEVRKQYVLDVATYAQAVDRRLMFEQGKPVEKDLAIQKMMKPLDLGGKGATYTAAERIVESDPQYSKYLQQYREAVRLEEMNKAQVKAGEMRHTELIALLTISGAELVRFQEVM